MRVVHRTDPDTGDLLSIVQEQPNEQIDPKEAEQALVLLGEHGSQSSLDDPWHGYAFHVATAPEYLSLDELGAEHSYCHTVLHNGLSDPKAIPGFRVAYQFTTGEQECPWCGPCSGEEVKPEECKLCDGSQIIYWGDDWVGLVFAPIDPDVALVRVREILKLRDNDGALPSSEAIELGRLIADLDACATECRRLPEDWE